MISALGLSPYDLGGYKNRTNVNSENGNNGNINVSGKNNTVFVVGNNNTDQRNYNDQNGQNPRTMQMLTLMMSRIMQLFSQMFGQFGNNNQCECGNVNNGYIPFDLTC